MSSFQIHNCLSSFVCLEYLTMKGSNKVYNESKIFKESLLCLESIYITWYIDEPYYTWYINELLIHLITESVVKPRYSIHPFFLPLFHLCILYSFHPSTLPYFHSFITPFFYPLTIIFFYPHILPPFTFILFHISILLFLLLFHACILLLINTSIC